MNSIWLLLLLVAISNGHEGEHDDSMPKPEAVLIEEYPFYGYNFSYSTSESENWLNSGSLAHYLSIHAIKSLSIPVTINIILLGFEGDGSEGINLKPEDLKPWFEHLDHYVSHVVVPVGEDQTTTNVFHTENIPIEYSLHLNVLKLCPLVTTILEDTIYWNLRPEEAETGEQSHIHANQDRINYYVNSDKFENILADLVHYLKISDTYTLFILNPHHPFDTPKERYGYRSGFSDSELALLYTDNSFATLKKKSDDAIKKSKQVTQENTSSSSKLNKDNKTKYREVSEKIQYRDFIEDSENWAQRYLEKQKSKEGTEEQMKYIETPVNELANYWLEKGNFYQQQYINDVIQKPTTSHENCLVDIWISSNKFAWIDLSAGPFEFGPVIAGEGVRSLQSLPTIPPRIKLLQEKNQSIAGTGHSHSSEDRYKEYIFELTLLQSYYDQLCSQDQRYQSEKLCNDLQSRISKLKNPSELSSTDSLPIISGGDEEGLHSSMLLDDVLSRLSSIVSSSIRHIFLPASPLYRTPFAERIIFHFFEISNEIEKEQEEMFSYSEYVRELRKLKLPSQDFIFAKKRILMSEDTDLLNAFTKSLRTTNIPKLSLDGQFSTFSQIYLDSKEIQHYLKILSTDSLDQKEDQDSQEFLMSRHIPIFLFSLGKDSTPLLIDKYYQAKAMSDMILIVKSNVNSWESRLSCDKKPIYWNLNNPLKAALSATSLLLSGLIPTHISYSDATHRAYQNWMWSVGDSPFSYTSSQYTFSEIHKDITFRNYIVTSLSDSLQIVNEGAAILANLKTNLENERAIPLLPLRNISKAYAEVRSHWVELIQSASHSSYAGSTSRLKSLSDTSKEFRELVTQAAETLDLLKCIPVKKDSFLTSNLDWLLPLCIVVDIIFVFVFLLFRRRKHKIKIN